MFQKVQVLLQEEEKKRILSNFLSLLVLQSANFLLPLIILPYLVRTLEPEKFGLIMFAQAFITYFTIFTDYGFNLSATREISIARENKEKISKIFSAVMLIKIILLIISFLLLSAIVFSFTRFKEDRLVFIFTFGIVLGQTIFPVWFFQGIERMKYITILNIIAKLIFMIAIFLVVHQTSDYLYVPILNSMGYIIAGLISLYIIFSHFDIQLHKPKKSMLIRLFKESTQLFFSNLSVTLFTISNTFILGLLTNNTIVGVYASIERVIIAIKNLYIPLYQALFPWLSKKNKKEIEIFIRRLIPIIFIISLLFFIILLFFAEDILNILYSNPIIIQHVLIFKFFSLISIFAALNMLFNLLYLSSIRAYKERMNIMLKSGLYSITTTIVMTFFFGIYGTAFSAVSTELVLLLFGIYYFTKIRRNG
ncbi:Membrane protein [Dissulfuribacter thermophilus]|uniref:Membrane protein n=1 Tax=Dissulfuribacter thermophilus TaxID=1156395 RepID=A0A1B9F738_9BACT|nr:oligosaccharide flippase family protein [Dissulfuribacter thermophilus]OCC15615.1 Membrane protein [Dissulfuribacter thermophilus]